MYDLFLSFNNADRADVAAIASDLRNLGVRVWFDEWDVVPGARWQDALATGLRQSRVVAVFVGPSGIGPWENAEAQVALDRAFLEPGYRVIPVLLPGAPSWEKIRAPAFINLFSGIAFREGLRDPEALRKLISGIRGVAPGAPPATAAPFALNQTQSTTGEAALRCLAKAAELEDCLAALGIPAAAGPGFLEWLLAECADQRNISGGSRIVEDLRARLAATSMVGKDAQASEAFLREWITSLSGPTLLGSSFYLSRNKITRTYKAFESNIKELFIGRRRPPGDSGPEAKFLATHRYFFETGNLVFLPARDVLGKPLLWGLDPVFYFVGVFVLDRPEEIREAFPEFEGLATTIGLANYVFEHPDPYLYPYVSLTGYLGRHPVSMTMSRKYVDVSSITIHQLYDLLRGGPVLIAGIGSIEVGEAGRHHVQPVACRFAGAQSWLEAAGPGGE
jgi:hypothetical protein